MNYFSLVYLQPIIDHFFCFSKHIVQKNPQVCIPTLVNCQSKERKRKKKKEETAAAVNHASMFLSVKYQECYEHSSELFIEQ
jgi:hypothetical protein